MYNFNKTMAVGDLLILYWQTQQVAHVTLEYHLLFGSADIQVQYRFDGSPIISNPYSAIALVTDGGRKAGR